MRNAAAQQLDDEQDGEAEMLWRRSAGYVQHLAHKHMRIHIGRQPDANLPSGSSLVHDNID
jgi:hypothetical protein